MKEMLDAIVRSEPRLATPSTRGGPSIDDLKTLLEISQAVNATLDLDEILRMVMDYAIKLVSAERGFIMLVEDGELVIRQSHNVAPELFGTEGDRFSRTIARRVLETGQSIYTSDAQEDKRFLERQSVHELHLRSIMGVPLKVEDRVIGVIYLDNSSEARLFLQSDLYILELLAQQASIALTNASLLSDVRSLQQYAENIVASTPLALLVLDPISRVLRSNERGAYLLTGLGAQSREGTSWLDLMGDDRESWAALFRGVLQSGNANSWARHPVMIAGAPHIFRVNVSPLTSDDARPNGIVLTLDDITDSERMREELLRAEVSIRKADEIGNIAHEMNNFLTILSNQAEIDRMALERGNFEKIEAGLPRTLDAVDKLHRLIESLLRPDRIEPQPADFQLCAAVESLAVWLRAEKRFDLVDLQFDVSPDLPAVRFDPQHLEMALYNLFKNAAEAMAEADIEDRRISLSARADGAYIIVHVADSGPGLPANRQTNPWERGESAKEGGHGRGLHNTAVFIQKNGGRIEAEPRSSLGGAGFKIYLPIAGA